MAEAAEQRIALVVLGMHRSGTSALTRVLSLLGADLPQNVMAAGSGNVAGHWEPDRLVAIHDEMLAAARSSWEDWRAFPPSDQGTESEGQYRRRIAAALNVEYGQSSLFVVKDPRLARFVPLYIDVFSALKIDDRHVLCIRNPLAVARSLAARDGMPIAAGLVLWLRHVLDSEVATRGRKRSLVEYEALVKSWRPEVERMTATLDIRWPADIDDSAKSIGEFLRSELRHQRDDGPALAHERLAHGWIIDAYWALRELADAPRNDRAERVLDEIRQDFNHVTTLFGAAVLEPYRDLSDRLANAEATTRREVQHAAEAELALANLQASASWRLTRPLRLARRLVVGSRPMSR